MNSRQARKIIRLEHRLLRSGRDGRALLVRFVRGSTHRRALRFLVRATLRGTFWSSRTRESFRDRFPREIREGFLRNYVIDLGGTVRSCEDALGFAVWYEDIRNRKVAFDELPDGTEVSTVFLGIDHNFRSMCNCGAAHADGGDRRPLLFETAVRRPQQGYDPIARSATRAEALEGHALIVGALMSGKFEENDSGVHIDMDTLSREGASA